MKTAQRACAVLSLEVNCYEQLSAEFLLHVGLEGLFPVGGHVSGFTDLGKIQCGVDRTRRYRVGRVREVLGGADGLDLAAVAVAKELVHNVKFLNITCAPEGKLAVESADDPNALTLLIPRANDKGFAMTGSYSCMTLLSTLIFDTASDEQKAEWVETIAKMGEEVISREPEIADYLAGDFNRVTYLGSGSFGGLAQESQLKILELAHGLVATSYDTSMGYRHGPKSFVDDKTLVFVFVNNDAYTRQYDIDILNEIGGDEIAQHTVAVQQEGATVYEGESFTFKGYEALPEGYLALPFVMFAQAISLLNSVRVGNTPDTPSPTGTVNRVVKGVTIHPFTA